MAGNANSGRKPIYKERVDIHIVCEKEERDNFYKIGKKYGLNPNAYFRKMMGRVIEYESKRPVRWVI